ncbi:tRNA (5-methylaminomethyl-2-thiouridine)(34)-methyltransferase MnmD [Roseibacterium beibuensis]|uniref:tRNA (5-methylaminomethyl-2-thiouridine)(34)-methyltransferase MnmD n=1 Tax=[Roseibacterium] beibuensis TaxID=1193142 RepID=A0ABP9LCW8_9RHOB|nr:tRNA (5-methylaminomethyl-2-thiouridine)(34)-methyltransferase MnmD [Roseibacterium beibuensis]MCS6623304.1 tRNA (5-methylaminomethyl-2-thiouridine)(34)-methyltransferase MnmD [Roseibacterium beibuensis]
MAENQRTDGHRLDWREGVPVSTLFDDPFYSLENGLAETRHVFLSGNDLPARFAPGFRVAELGFGTGLNLVAVHEAWVASGTAGPLTVTSFEAFPVSPGGALRALAHFPEAEGLAPLIAGALSGLGRIETPTLDFTLVVGDARKTVPAWGGVADAWFLDGFSPAKNPELWEPGLMQAVFDHTAPGGSFATYSAAGAVRRALGDAGFRVERRTGYGRKRHMSIGVKP